MANERLRFSSVDCEVCADQQAVFSFPAKLHSFGSQSSAIGPRILKVAFGKLPSVSEMRKVDVAVVERPNGRLTIL